MMVLRGAERRWCQVELRIEERASPKPLLLKSAKVVQQVTLAVTPFSSDKA